MSSLKAALDTLKLITIGRAGTRHYAVQMHNAFAAVSSLYTVHGNSHAWAPHESVFVAIELLKAYI